MSWTDESLFPIEQKNFRERFLLPFNTLEIDLHMLVGNHDIYFKNTNDINSLQELIGQEQRRFKIYPELKLLSLMDCLFLCYLG